MTDPFRDPLHDRPGLGDLFDVRRCGLVVWAERPPGGLVVVRAQLVRPSGRGWEAVACDGWENRTRPGVHITAELVRSSLSGAPLRRLEP